MKLNLYDALQHPEQIIETMKDADIATLTLVLTYITSDLSYLEKIKPYVKGAFDYDLEPGMALCIEALVSPKGGDFSIKLEDQVLVTEDGFENLTKFPFCPFLMGEA